MTDTPADTPRLIYPSYLCVCTGVCACVRVYMDAHVQIWGPELILFVCLETEA